MTTAGTSKPSGHAPGSSVRGDLTAARLSWALGLDLFGSAAVVGPR